MADPIPPNPEADVFKLRWVRPRDALVLFRDIGSGEAIQEIASRLRSGMLFAAGSPAASKSSGVNDPRFVIIPDQWPTHDGWLAEFDPLWITGRTKLKMGRDGRSYEYFGVRLEPDGLQRMADEIGLPLAISGKAKLAHVMAHGAMTAEGAQNAIAASQRGPMLLADLPAALAAVLPEMQAPAKRVLPPYAARAREPQEKPRKATKDELRQWFPSYEAASQDFRYDSVCAAATAHFHPRPVTRTPLREVIGEFERTRTRGKPSDL